MILTFLCILTVVLAIIVPLVIIPILVYFCPRPLTPKQIQKVLSRRFRGRKIHYPCGYCKESSLILQDEVIENKHYYSIFCTYCLMGTYIDQERIKRLLAFSPSMEELESVDSAITVWNEEGERREWTDWHNPDSLS